MPGYVFNKIYKRTKEENHNEEELAEDQNVLEVVAEEKLENEL